MEKLNFVKADGMVKLPPGFRFQPTDEEIVFQYLARKIFALPLPASVVPEIINISQYNPWDLPGEWEEDRYFFNKCKISGTSRTNKASGCCGYWKATGLEKKITRKKHDDELMGIKKTLVFYNGNNARTNWIMHEYRLVRSQNAHSYENSFIQIGSWVICHIFLKISGDDETADLMTMNYLSDQTPCSSSSASSSSVVTDDDDDDDETNGRQM